MSPRGSSGRQRERERERATKKRQKTLADKGMISVGKNREFGLSLSAVGNHREVHVEANPTKSVRHFQPTVHRTVLPPSTTIAFGSPHLASHGTARPLNDAESDEQR